MDVNLKAFAPEPGKTVNITAGTVSGRVQVQVDPVAHRHVRVLNTGTVPVFLRFGDSTVTASLTADVPVAAGATELFSGPQPYVAVIVASGTAVVYLTPGEGA